MKIYNFSNLPISDKLSLKITEAPVCSRAKDIVGIALLAISVFVAIFISMPLGLALLVVSVIVLAIDEPSSCSSGHVHYIEPASTIVVDSEPAHVQIARARRARSAYLSSTMRVLPPDHVGPRVPVGTGEPTIVCPAPRHAPPSYTLMYPLPSIPLAPGHTVGPALGSFTERPTSSANFGSAASGGRIPVGLNGRRG